MKVTVLETIIFIFCEVENEVLINHKTFSQEYGYCHFRHVIKILPVRGYNATHVPWHSTLRGVHRKELEASTTRGSISTHFLLIDSKHHPL